MAGTFSLSDIGHPFRNRTFVLLEVFWPLRSFMESLILMTVFFVSVKKSSLFVEWNGFPFQDDK
jgi:hypothetical protein